MTLTNLFGTGIFCVLISTTALAEAEKVLPNLESEPKSMDVRFQPCDYWRYNSDIQGYVCSSTGMTVSVPDAYDVRTTISALNERIAALEARISTLESQ